MTSFEKLVLRGLWLILKQVMRSGGALRGADEVKWIEDVAEATEDEKLNRQNFKL